MRDEGARAERRRLWAQAFVHTISTTKIRSKMLWLSAAALAYVETWEPCHAVGLGLTQGWQLFVPGLVPAKCEENLKRRPQIMPAQ